MINMMKHNMNSTLRNLRYRKRDREMPKFNPMSDIIKCFYLKEDVSRVTNGKLTVIKKNIKVQRRLLNDSMNDAT